VQTWQLDATRPDRIFPDSFSYNVLGLNEINSINRVRYVPTYVITGTGEVHAREGGHVGSDAT
jgi:hypothetical protein